MSVLSNFSLHELVGGLCNYIKSINCPETLEKVWVQSSNPYPISLTLKRLQEMLNKELPMDRDCFNLVVRKIMFDNIQTGKQKRGSIHIPIKSNSDFMLIILDKDIRTVYILDPTPIERMYQRNPLAKYVHRILWIAEHLPKAMSKACPGSTWNENIFLWQQKIVHDISGHRRELSGYLVTLFMSRWEDEKLHLPFLKDGYELRK